MTANKAAKKSPAKKAAAKKAATPAASNPVSPGLGIKDKFVGGSK